jgi:hypothetical protein
MKSVVNSLFFILCLFSLNNAHAQKTYDFEWEHYSIVFNLAEDFKVVTNTAEEFSAVGDGMEFAIFPFNDASLDASDIADYTVEIAKSLELEEIDDADVLKLNGLTGAYVEGYKAGDRVVLLGFMDPGSATNFFATITFGDDDKNAEDEAVRMIKSFRKK